MEKDILKIGKENSIFPRGKRDYLVFRDRLIVPGILREDEDFFEIELDAGNLHPAPGLMKGQGPDRYRFLIASAQLEGLRKKYSFSAEPENLMYDDSFTPKVRLRDGARPADAGFAEEYKALIASILAPAYSFSDYLNGGTDLYKKNKLLKEIAPLESVDEIAEKLKDALAGLESELARDSILVGKGRYRTSRILMIVFACLFGVLLGYAIKYYMVDIAAKDTAIAVSNSHLSGDYIGVLDSIAGKDLALLSKEERYMAAYAGVSVAALNDKQRAAVRQVVSLNTDSLYLDYWIHIGLGGYEDALDISRRMGDDELELYALVVYRDKVSIDMNIPGTEKTETLKRLDDQINELEKRISELLPATEGK